MSQEPRPVTFTATPEQVETLWRRASWLATASGGDAAWKAIADELQAYYGPVAVPVVAEPGDDPADGERFDVQTHWRSAEERASIKAQLEKMWAENS